MAFKKTINANSTEIIKTGAEENEVENQDNSQVEAQSDSKDQYPEGKKFVYDGRTWVVREAFAENGEDWRRVTSSSGDEEVMTLKTLVKEAELMHDIN